MGAYAVGRLNAKWNHIGTCAQSIPHTPCAGLRHTECAAYVPVRVHLAARSLSILRHPRLPLSLRPDRPGAARASTDVLPPQVADPAPARTPFPWVAPRSGLSQHVRKRANQVPADGKVCRASSWPGTAGCPVCEWVQPGTTPQSGRQGWWFWATGGFFLETARSPAPASGPGKPRQ